MPSGQFPLISAWGFSRQYTVSPLQVLNTSEPRSPGSNNEIWVDWWLAEYGGSLKRWDGASWVAANLKTYLAASWQSKPLKMWNGTAWVLIG